MLPKESLPVVLADGKPHPVSINSALSSEGLGYAEFNTALEGMRESDRSSYVQGAVDAYGLLTGGYKPDIALSVAIVKMKNASQTKGRDGYGMGAMDIWRLLVENNRDVDAVIGRQQ